MIESAFWAVVSGGSTNVVPLTQMAILIARSSIVCAVQIVDAPEVAAVKLAVEFAKLLYQISSHTGSATLLLTCVDFLGPTISYISKLTVNLLASRDPNEKVGVSGAGPLRYVQQGRALSYAIYFENADTATGAAQDVEVVDRLDPAVYNFSSFQLAQSGSAVTLSQCHQGRDCSRPTLICARNRTWS